MPQVDFTLDELLAATDRQARRILREEFKPLFEAAFDPYALAIQQDFNRIYERLDALESGMRGVKRVVGLHSREIMGLKARQG